MRIVAADQCPCLNTCVIRHGSLSWWSIISLDFDFNQEDIRKREENAGRRRRRKKNHELKITNQSLNDSRGKRNQSTNS